MIVYHGTDKENLKYLNRFSYVTTNITTAILSALKKRKDNGSLDICIYRSNIDKSMLQESHNLGNALTDFVVTEMISNISCEFDLRKGINMLSLKEDTLRLCYLDNTQISSCLIKKKDDKNEFIKASMNFSFNEDKRPEIKSDTTFDAIVNGERTSATIYSYWKNIKKWDNCKVGGTIRFYSDRYCHDRYIDTIVIDMRHIDTSTFTDRDWEEWSKVEGWTTTKGKSFKPGKAIQVLYKVKELSC